METPTSDNQNQDRNRQPRTRRNRWLLFSIVVNVIIIVGVVGVAGASAVIHQSDTNPEFCASCHIMQPNVDSYLTSNHLDNVHAEAGVQCKECHSDYGVPEEIVSGLNFVTGNYTVNSEGHILKRDFDDDICTQCHGDMDSVARSTDFLFYNPHASGMGDFTCDTCHVSHGEQIDYCSECHENGGQRMIEDDTPRLEQLGVPTTHYDSMMSPSIPAAPPEHPDIEDTSIDDATSVDDAPVEDSEQDAATEEPTAEATSTQDASDTSSQN